ncbi:MAG: sodium-dependent bicarbonate transport family permease [Chloroflexi bacterium]|nr:sodium-dependent bicarbonate transport family permease [Chloroflexota bacterium]
MDLSLILTNLLNPPVLFFFLGIAAVLVKSDLEIPQPLPKFFSLYLLFSIGFKGGIELNHSGMDGHVLYTLVAAMGMSLLTPLWLFPLLRRRFDISNAAAIAATYGSISAVTFITASALLEQIGIPASGHMVAVMALMESPAIIAAIVLARRAGVSSGNTESHGTAGLLREALFNGSVLLLLGSLAIGMITGARGAKALYPFTSDIFQGFLSLFLLEMGISSARRFKDLRIFGIRPLVVAVGIPLVNATLGISLAWLGGLSRGDALIFTVLCASASYIAVPAVMRMSLPESNPGLFVPMALAITFPFNVAIGIPLYLGIIERLWR